MNWDDIIAEIKSYFFFYSQFLEIKKILIKKIQPQQRRPDQEAKSRCRDIAAMIWKEHPNMTIADMIKQDKIIAASTRKDGKLYVEKTVHGWLKDLCPNPKPGRRPQKQN
jgi:hypothetical protein